MSLNWLGIGLELSFSSNTFSAINAIKLYRRISNALLFCPNLWSKRQQKSRQRHLSAISDMSQGQYLFSAITATSLSLSAVSQFCIYQQLLLSLLFASSSSSLYSCLFSSPLLPHWRLAGMQCQQQHTVPHTHLWAPLHDITDVMQTVLAVDIPTEAHSSKGSQ